MGVRLKKRKGQTSVKRKVRIRPKPDVGLPTSTEISTVQTESKPL